MALYHPPTDGWVGPTIPGGYVIRSGFGPTRLLDLDGVFVPLGSTGIRTFDRYDLAADYVKAHFLRWGPEAIGATVDRKSDVERK